MNTAAIAKIVAAAGAIEDGLATPNTRFNCTSERVDYKGRTLKLPGEDHHMGNLTVAEIIAHSSNKGAAQLGMRLGEEKLYNYARAFGFGRTHGFPVGGEVGGILRPWKDWNPVDITRIPMGHTVSATVLQMHQAMLVIASATAMRPVKKRVPGNWSISTDLGAVPCTRIGYGSAISTNCCTVLSTA